MRPRGRNLALEPLEQRTLLSAGDLNPTFGTDGVVLTDMGSCRADAAFDIVVATQGDAGLVVVGRSFQAGTDYDFALARYNADGSLAAGFGSGGKVTTDFGMSADHACGAVIQADGKIVVVGYTSGGDTGEDFALARYNPDGTLDASFGVEGKVTTDFGSSFDRALDVAIQVVDGVEKLVVVGHCFPGGGNSYDFAVARYNPDGTLDADFGVQGKVTTHFDAFYGYDSAWSVALQADGKIVVAGHSYRGYPNHCDFAIARYNVDGSLDDSFGGNGKVLTHFGDRADYARGIAVQADGMIVVAGFAEQTGQETDFALARYDDQGNLDTSFGAGGKVITPFGSSYDFGRDVAVQEDGKIVVVGSSYQGVAAGYDFALARYDGTDGSLDASFHGDGKVTLHFGYGNDDAYGVALQANGNIVAGGYARQIGTHDDFALACFLAGVPPVADAGGPYTAVEGSPVTLDASASGLDGAALQYRWDFDADGVWDTEWLDSPTASYTWYDDWSGSVTVEVSDGQLTATATASVTVLNAAPVIAGFGTALRTLSTSEPAEGPTHAGDPITVSASFSDPGILDTHTAMVDWDDGTASPAEIVEFEGAGTIQASHAYEDGGIYTITVTLTDDDGGSHALTTTVQVVGMRLHDGVLQIVGDRANGHVNVRKLAEGQLHVSADFLQGAPFRRFDASQVEQIEVIFQDGDDQLFIQPQIQIPVLVDGGAGNDRLGGGAGADTILGGAGNDVLWGRDGDDLLDGGDGHDRIFAGTGNDTVLGGDGHDRIFAGTGSDSVRGGDGHDRVLGGAGDDVVWGEDGQDVLLGQAGNDNLFGGKGHDRILGGAGNDTVSGGEGHDVLFGNGGHDLIIGGDGADRLWGHGGDDILIGNTTAYDENVEALLALLAVWTSEDHETRLATLQDATRPTYLLGDDTVLDDKSADVLAGGGGYNWLLGNTDADKVIGRTPR